MIINFLLFSFTGGGTVSVASLQLNGKNVVTSFRFSLKTVMICVFRRISAYRLFLIVLSLYLLSCLICWDNSSIVEGLLLSFFFHLPGRNSSNDNC